MGNANVTLYAQWNGISVTLKATPAGPFHWNPDPVAFNEGATDLSWITTGDPDECFPT